MSVITSRTTSDERNAIAIMILSASVLAGLLAGWAFDTYAAFQWTFTAVFFGCLLAMVLWARELSVRDMLIDLNGVDDD